MNGPERGSYHHGHLREALLEEGLAMTRSAGTSGLVLRELARRVGVAPTAVYRHFADRDSLLAELAARLQAEVAARMDAERERLRGADGPRAALCAVGLGYIAFAIEEPGWFEVAFAGVVPAPSSGWPLLGSDRLADLPLPLARLVAALDGLVAAGELDTERRAGAEWPCWSAVHGFALLVLQGPLRGMPPGQRRRAAERTVDTVVAGILA